MSETFWVIPTINSPNYKKFRTKAIHSSNTSTQKRGARNSRMGTRPLLSIVKHDKLYRVYGFVMRKGGSTLYSRAQLKNETAKKMKQKTKTRNQFCVDYQCALLHHDSFFPDETTINTTTTNPPDGH